MREKQVKFLFPKLGDKKEILELAETNAKYILREYQVAQFNREQIIPKPVLSLQRDLKLRHPPRI